MRVHTIVLIACAALLSGSAASASSFTEVGDATNLAPGQTVEGVGVVTSIEGSIDFVGDADLYRITIFDASVFSVAIGATTLSDTQLFLFDIGGAGIAHNDDGTGIGFLSEFPAGDPAYNGLAPGDYLVGISAWNNDPVDAGGNPLFSDTASPNVVGPLSGNPVDAWANRGSTGDYELLLEGARFSRQIPEPSAALLFAAGFGVAGLSRRRRH